MKKIINIISILLAGVFITSCEKDGDIVTLTEISKSTFSTDKGSIVLSEIISEQTAVTFSWAKPTFDVAIVPKQQIEFGIKGKNFKDSKTVDIEDGKANMAITHATLNTLMFNLGANPDAINQVEARLKTNTGSSAYYSNAIDLSVTPFTPNPDLIYPKINVPGAYGAAAGYDNWSPANTANLYSPEKNEKYRGFIYITSISNEDSKYKFTVNQDWPGNKGDDGTKTGKLVGDGSDIVATTTGTHYIKVDWVANTYSDVVANFGVIGDATPTGWNSDTDLVYNPATKTYVINSIALSNNGGFKFRANDDWALKFQPISAEQTLVSGKGVMTYFSAESTITNDPNYKVQAAGNYKIELDLHNSANYKLTVTKL
ncbi:SusE domain-containing protein [Chryseobacterium sp.]|uniref:SusE domain-containing protein n=1 Tax=Chryseobacterium sp. TaxID=1871047 RepID=UPI00388D05BE